MTRPPALDHGPTDSGEPGGDDPLAGLAAAVAALPLPPGDPGARWSPAAATAAWLAARRSPHTRRAYFRDLADYLTWLDGLGLDPRQARRGDIDLYLAALRQRPRPPSQSSQRRRLAALSSWYTYLASHDLADRNPAATVDRPPVDRDHSPTVGLTVTEVTALLRAADTELHHREQLRQAAARYRTLADQHRYNGLLLWNEELRIAYQAAQGHRPVRYHAALRNRVLLGLLATLGLRVGEVIALDLTHLRHNAGHRTLLVPGKGDRTRELPIPASLGRHLDAYLELRRCAAPALSRLREDLDKQWRELSQERNAAEAQLLRQMRRAGESFPGVRDRLQAMRRAGDPAVAALNQADSQIERIYDQVSHIDSCLDLGTAPDAPVVAQLPAPTGPLLVTATGCRLTQAYVFALLRRLAHAAELPAADHISPHSLRHSAATAALDDGATLRDVQDFLGHADPRTTRRYDRNRGSLDRSPAHRLAMLYTDE